MKMFYNINNMNKTLLIADDDSMFVDILMFESEKRQLPWQIVAVSDGQHTILKLQEHRPDILVLDLRMPNVDGFAVLEHMRTNHSDVPVIVVTHYSNAEYREKSMSYGVREYIVKSDWRIDRLVDRIDHHLTGAPQV